MCHYKEALQLTGQIPAYRKDKTGRDWSQWRMMVVKAIGCGRQLI